MSLPSGLQLPFQPVPSPCKSATVHLFPSDFLVTTLAHYSSALPLPLSLRGVWSLSGHELIDSPLDRTITS
eukprot:11416775-Ditylum_brightwellii.AAC.1